MIEFTGERFVPTERGVIRQEHLHRYAWCLPLVAGKRVLDIASGEGYGSAMLASRAASVVGVDISDEAVSHASERYAEIPDLRYLQGSAADIPLESAQFDVVVSFETIEHLLEQEQMLAEIRRVLKPSGLLIMSSPNKEVYSDKAGYHNEYHVAELYHDDFVALLKAQFPAVRLEGQRISVASTITPLIADDGLQFMEGLADTGDVVQPRVAALPEPVYFIALAAAEQASLPPQRPSVMYSESEDLYVQYLEIGRWAKAQDAEIKSLREHVRREQAEVEHLRSSGEILLRRLDESKKQHHAHEELLSMDAMLELLSFLREGASAQEATNNGLFVVQEQVRFAQEELHAIKTALQSAKNERHSNAARLQAIRDHLGSSDRRLSEILQRNAFLEFQGQQHEELLHRVEDIQVQSREREVLLDTIVHSRSWMLTQPLRFLGRIARGDAQGVRASLDSPEVDKHTWLAPLIRTVRNWLKRHEK